MRASATKNEKKRFRIKILGARDPIAQRSSHVRRFFRVRCACASAHELRDLFAARAPPRCCAPLCPWLGDTTVASPTHAAWLQRQAMDGSESPQDELLGGFDFLGDIDPVLWDELNSREPGSSSDNNFTFEAAAPTLRCVDATHNSANCTKCTACPPAELAHKYELMGEDGKVRPAPLTFDPFTR